MINLIIGNKGSGKTKRLIKMVNDACEASQGNVVCLEKEPLLTYDVNSRVRLIDTDRYMINGYDELYAFISGISARDFDITDMFVDATLKIGGKDFAALAAFFKRIDSLCKVTEKEITFTVSADESDLPAEIFDFCKVV